MKVLVVEDNEKLAASLRKGLEAEGYAVDQVADGRLGLDFGLNSKAAYDIAILDLMLPNIDGLEICRQWRRNKVSIPVLMLTARSAVGDRINGLDAGADDYLPKPFVFDELLARLRALLRRRPVTASGDYQIQDISIDPLGFRATVRGQDAKLTLKEFRLLELFLHHADQVLSRDQIIANLWGYDFDGDSNVVDVHVKNLRKKLESIRKAVGDNHETIETVRGLGYRFKG